MNVQIYLQSFKHFWLQINFNVTDNITFYTLTDFEISNL